MDLAVVDELIAAVRSIGSAGPAEARSVRRDPAVDRALRLAVALGWGESVSGLAEDAVEDRLRLVAHEAAVAAHYERYPEDRPSRAQVAAVALERAGDPLAERLDLLQDVERSLADRLGRDPTTDELVAGAIIASGSRASA